MVDTGPLDTLTGANIMATAIRYDRPSIFRDAWARAKAAAAEAAESVRPFFGTALPAAKAALAASAPAPAGPRRYEHRDGAYATLYRRVRAIEGQYHVTVLALQPDGTEHVAGAVLLYPKRYGHSSFGVDGREAGSKPASSFGVDRRPGHRQETA
ncbi:hypothetical protein [Methylobacterium ajmalii]|uniref:hypothetical protein n=1 Tax=Methylobacterium ajmalii TaxID=2738439 RepID=UPI001909C858|nr:hypothetical protein [Methylobacterium ajmalii]MBK3396698.1 hypothetical protein [Methylobacterium ajmalii]